MFVEMKKYSDNYEVCHLTGDARLQYLQQQKNKGIHEWIMPWDDASRADVPYFVDDSGNIIADDKWNEYFYKKLDTIPVQADTLLGSIGHGTIIDGYLCFA